MTDFLQPTEREIERVRDGLRLHKRRNQCRDGLQRALDALHGPPPTPEQLAEARSLVAAQKARDFCGDGGLFE